MNKQIEIKVTNLCKSFKSNLLFDNASMSASTGEIIALVGENGCGKSTLLNMLTGLEKTDSGEILYLCDGEKIPSVKFGDCISYVPQNNYLLSDLSAYDNLLFWYRGDKLALEKDTSEGIIKELGIDAYLKKRVGKLSVGMQKRVALACALASKPSILLLDEVNAPLDIICRIQIRKILKSYADAGNIVILSTHDEGDIEICTKIYYINNCKINDINGQSLQQIFKDKL